jgi:hypothetical protein
MFRKPFWLGRHRINKKNPRHFPAGQRRFSLWGYITQIGTEKAPSHDKCQAFGFRSSHHSEKLLPDTGIPQQFVLEGKLVCYWMNKYPLSLGKKPGLSLARISPKELKNRWFRKTFLAPSQPSPAERTMRAKRRVITRCQRLASL